MQTNMCIYVSNTFWLILTILCSQRVSEVVEWEKCTVLYCTVLYCTVLYCTVLYCIVLYCTVLSSWMWIVHVWDRVRNSWGPGRAGRADSRSNGTHCRRPRSLPPGIRPPGSHPPNKRNHGAAGSGQLSRLGTSFGQPESIFHFQMVGGRSCSLCRRSRPFRQPQLVLRLQLVPGSSQRGHPSLHRSWGRVLCYQELQGAVEEE